MSSDTCVRAADVVNKNVKLWRTGGDVKIYYTIA